MNNFDYTPIPQKFTFLRGQSWKFTLTLTDEGELVNLNHYSITAIISSEGVEYERLSKNHGIDVAADGLLCILKKDWTVVGTDTNNNAIFTPPISELPTGIFSVQLIFTENSGREVSPVYFYIDIQKKPSDASVERASSDFQIDVTMDGGLFVGLKVSPISDRIEWRTFGTKVKVRYIGEETWHDWVDLYNVPFPASLGGYNATTNSPAITAIPSITLSQGSYLDTIVAGTLGFAGVNFAAGTVVNVGDILKVQGTQWLLVQQGQKIQKSFIKPNTATYTDLENKVLTAIQVLDLTVPSAQRNDDWRITYVSTIPSTPDLVAGFKYKIQVRNVTTGTSFTIVDENSTFNANTLNGDKIYRGSLIVSGTSITFNVQVDWVYLLSLGATFEFNILTSNLKIKPGVFTQTDTIVALVDAGDSKLFTEISSTRYDFLADKTKNYTATEVNILRALKLLDIIVPAAEKNDDWRITFVTTTPTTMGLVPNFKYRFQIRNLTTGKDYALINENSTFDASTLNGFKSYNGTIVNGTTSITFNISLDWNYLLNLGAMFEHNNYATNLSLRPGVFSQTTDNILRISALEASSTLVVGTKIPTIENILSDFYSTRLYTIYEGYYTQQAAYVPNNTRRYVKMAVKPGDIFKVTSTVNGSALALAIFVDTNNAVLQVVEPGADGVDHPHINYQLTAPANASFVYIDGSSSVDIVIDRMNNGWVGIDGVVNSNTYRRYAKYPVSPTDKLRVTTTVNGSGVYAVLYLNAAGSIISYQGQGINGSDKLIENLQMVIPSTATHFILNSNAATPYYIYTPSLIAQSASRVYVDSLIAQQNTLIAALQLKNRPMDGMTALFLGTSLIDSSLFPTDAPALLGGVGINKGVGSSTARISRADGTFAGLAWQNYCYALMHKIEEKQYIIDNWATIKSLFYYSAENPSINAPLTLSSTEQAKILSCSYENRILPYLNGTYPMPNIIAIEHGRNDGYANDLTTMPAIRNDRRYYLGAMNFLIDLIYQYNSFPNIVLIGYYEDDDLVNVSAAQMMVANAWNIPILKTWELSGFSQQKVLGSSAKWTQLPWSNYVPTGQDTTQDMTVRRVQLPDNIHYSSDTSGKAQAKMTTIVKNFLKAQI